MSQDNISSWLDSAVSGDRQAREELIAYYRPFILKEAQHVCRRPLQWGHDDELSIALIAFDEAIDAYKKSKGGSFNLLCRLVIKRRLIDYFRQVEKHDDIPDTDRLISSAAFNEDWERSEREREIEKYSKLLLEALHRQGEGVTTRDDLPVADLLAGLKNKLPFSELRTTAMPELPPQVPLDADDLPGPPELPVDKPEPGLEEMRLTLLEMPTARRITQGN